MSAAAQSVIPQSQPQRLPGSVVASIALHAAALGLWLYTMQQAAKHHVTIVNNVEFIKVNKQLPTPSRNLAKQQQANTTFDFLKMALPSIPKVAAPKLAPVELPKTVRQMQVQTPKLQDKGRLDTGPKLDMDLTRDHSLDAAKIEAKIPTRRVNALANMPRLEEVGRRRVANLPAAIAMEERRQEAMGLQGADALAKATRDRRGSSVAAAPALTEAAPPGGSSSRFSQKIASLLPEQAIDTKPAVMNAPAIKEPVAPPAASHRKAAQLDGGDSKKGVEIEGPLADRKVLAYEIPEFPAWAKEQGVLEANVSIRFWVNKDGDVLPNMRVEHTSGYGRLDRLAMDALAKWKFAPLLSQEKQWGVITFRFLLE